MPDLFHTLLLASCAKAPHAPALRYQSKDTDYASLMRQVNQLASGYLNQGIARSERIAIYLEKRPEAVVAMFAASAASAAFVPVNPLLKAEQVAYILADCNVKILVTSAQRLRSLTQVLATCPDLHSIIVLDTEIADELELPATIQSLTWTQALAAAELAPVAAPCIDADMAAILYTSGSTGKPKGVVLSHRNLLAGAASVSAYLNNQSSDRILAVLPLSFDYGLSQVTTALSVGACVVLMNYLMPQDIVRAVTTENITGLAAVPPLWLLLAQQKWPKESTLRYLTNSGGAMPKATLEALRVLFPAAKIYLMYGLTEAFRSSYLDPDEVDARPDSIGKAIPGVELIVMNQQGQPCAANEAGELVHRGALVALGYWNDAEKTAERFRPLPPRLAGLPLPEIAVWSGDTVRMDEQGFLYFIGREDDMIKVSGYRVSPSEVEEVVADYTALTEIAAVGVPHPLMGQAIILVLQQNAQQSLQVEAIRQHSQQKLPAYMVPAHIQIVSENLPRNTNGKIDRKSLQTQFQNFFLTSDKA
ncbi:acyl-CoA ligase (AMP-forming), exosortase A system-associated [Undibacterium sp. Ren11W]|uniref:acyl-CoA ligase (AMP-forming), exosortase A system-associated n=1 Tax=Undibacterium sp. Ren11W TaxID=3413045 RepID=UPI003BF1E8F7